MNLICGIEIQDMQLLLIGVSNTLLQYEMNNFILKRGTEIDKDIHSIIRVNKQCVMVG